MYKVDGMNVFNMKEGMKFAKDYAIKNGPLYIEADCYRYHGIIYLINEII